VSGFRDGAATAAVAGELCAVFRSLHRILGVGALEAPSAATTVYFDERSLEHAFHAELLFERLPLRAGFDREEVVALGALQPGLDLLASLGTAGDEVGLLAGYGSLLVPWVAHSLDQMAERSSEAADRSLRRAIRLICSDLDAARQPTDRLLAEIAGADGAAAHAGRVIADLGSQLGI
jgi:hypothetical protein